MCKVNYHLPKELKRVIEVFIRIGWELSRIGKHLVYKHPKGATVTVSKTPSNKRALKLIFNDFKRESKKLGLETSYQINDVV